MLTGIILAGGPNRRMGGRNKSLLLLEGMTLIERQIRIMRELCSEIIIVTNTPKVYLRLVDESIRIITDYIPNHGPLGGMHAGLTLSQNRDVWIVSCDMPYLSIKAAELMLRRKRDGYEAVIPSIANVLYPLCGIYDRGCALHIWSQLMNKDMQTFNLFKSLQWLALTETDFQSAGIDTQFLESIHTDEDYIDVQRQLSNHSLKMNETMMN